ncbi:MAG: hypothetical protein JJT76_12815 [Clostridiaceae bacterium]|nr:hypothetical protein [Clostridiaceae bacterium]
MKIKESIGIKGRLSLKIKKRGQVIEEWEDDNVVVDIPRAEIAKRLAGVDIQVLPITQIAIGTNATAEDQSNESITNAFIKPVVSVTNPLPTITEVQFLIETEEAVGMEICEFGLIRSDGSLFARRTRGVIEKDNELEIEGVWTVRV